MEIPETRYAITDDDVRIAYHDFGHGVPVVLVDSPYSHVEGTWEFSFARRVFERLAANVRVFTFDDRGTGMSDGFSVSPSLADRTLDVKAVLDSAGIERATLSGFDFGAQLAMRFSIDFPDRVERLVLINAKVGDSAKDRADRLNPDAAIALPHNTREARLEQIDTIGMVSPDEIDEVRRIESSPSAADFPDERSLYHAWERKVGSRDVWRRQIESVSDIDVTDLVPEVTTPTLITHTVGNRMFHVGYARLLAELIPNSELVEFDGEDHLWWMGDSWREIVDTHLRFITGSDVDLPLERAFAVVLFTDIVESTRAGLAAGDAEWRRRLDIHDRIADRVVAAHSGSIVKSTGDGILAMFDAPSRAIDAAVQLRDELRVAEIDIRAGLHAGEVESRGGDISGAVVNLAARVEQTAEDSQIRVTQAIKDMLLGSDHRFDPAAVTRLKGFDGDWALYRVGNGHGAR